MARDIIFKGMSVEVAESPAIIGQVQECQEILWDNGMVGPDNPFWRSRIAKRLGITSPEHPRAKGEWIDGDFGTWTEEAVKFIQLHLLGPSKYPLDEITKAGVVDLDTWWALEHPQPRYQTQNIKTSELARGQDPETQMGVAFITVWDYYIELGIKEIPNGSNRGPYVKPLWPGAKHGGIDWWIRYNPKSKRKGPAHCCFDRCGIEWEAHGFVTGKGKYVNSGGRVGLCYNNYKWGKKQTRVPYNGDYDKTTDAPMMYFTGWVVNKKDVVSGKVKLPTGTALIMNYGGIRGHTETVAKTNYKNGKAITIETRGGNIGNKLDRRRRNLAQSSVKWFIIAPELLVDPDFQGVGAKDVKKANRRESTR